MGKKWYSHTVAYLVLFLLIFSLQACSSKEEPKKGGALATVNGENISVKDLREFLGVRAGAHRVFGVPRARMKSALESIIAGRLLASEGRKKGYDKDKAFMKRYEDAKNDLYISSLFREKVGNVVTVTEGQIKDESKKIMEKEKKISEAEALQKATEGLYDKQFKESDNIIVAKAQKKISMKIKDETLKKISSGKTLVDSTAVATVNGDAVTYGEVKEELGNVAGHNVSGLVKDVNALKAILKRISIKRGLLSYAMKEKVDERETFSQLKKNFENSLLVSLFIEKDLRKGLKVTVEEAKKEYDSHPEMFIQGEQVKARHILVKDEKTANEVYEKVKKGEDFGKVAKKYSTGPSASNGGELGYFGKGKMVKPFETAAFALKVGEISKPVKTSFGYHVIQVTDRKKKSTIPFKNIKDKWIQYLTEKKANEKVHSVVEELRKKADVKIDESLLDAV